MQTQSWGPDGDLLTQSSPKTHPGGRNRPWSQKQTTASGSKRSANTEKPVCRLSTQACGLQNVKLMRRYTTIPYYLRGCSAQAGNSPSFVFELKRHMLSKPFLIPTGASTVCAHTPWLLWHWKHVCTLLLSGLDHLLKSWTPHEHLTWPPDDLAYSIYLCCHHSVAKSCWTLQPHGLQPSGLLCP